MQVTQELEMLVPQAVKWRKQRPSERKKCVRQDGNRIGNWHHSGTSLWFLICPAQFELADSGIPDQV